MSTGERRRVAMVISDVRQYRVTFLELLRQLLDDENVALDLIYSVPSGVEGGRGDFVDLPWATRIAQRHIKLAGFEVTWQSALGMTRDADLVIVQQAMRRLLNYLLLARQSLWRGPPVAFWGHGRNFQATSSAQSVSESLKRRLSRRAHWFFTYNDLTAEVLGEMGYPEERVSVIVNSIDTRSAALARDRVTDAQREMLRDELGLKGDHVGIFVGSMYQEKRLPFLVEAASEVRQRVPDFELICVGSGVDRHVIEQASSENDWIHYVGAQVGDDLAQHFALAKVFLLPGLVGLGVLDSFVFEVPLVTTSEALHSPEISYLEDGVNGLMVAGDGSGGTFSDAVASVLTDDELRARLIDGCRRSAKQYSVEAMAERFADGVLKALDAPRIRS